MVAIVDAETIDRGVAKKISDGINEQAEAANGRQIQRQRHPRERHREEQLRRLNGFLNNLGKNYCAVISNFSSLFGDNFGLFQTWCVKMAAAGSGVAFMTSSSSKVAEELRLESVKEIRSHEVAIAELNHLSSSRAVYQKNGNLFFRTSIQRATASEQKQLDMAKAKLQKLNPS